MASGCCTEHSRHETLPLLQKVLLDNASLDARKPLFLQNAFPRFPNSFLLWSQSTFSIPCSGVPVCLRDGPGHVCHPPEPEKDTIELVTIQHLKEVTHRHYALKK